MKTYLQLLRHILDHGTRKNDRTGTGTLSVFGYQMRFDLAAGFPLLTTKKVHTKSIIYELLWFLRGETNVKWLQDKGVTIWNEWADDKGDLGPVYGKQWRNWKPKKKKIERATFNPDHPSLFPDGDTNPQPDNYGMQWRSWQTADGRTVDQIQQAVQLLKTNPDSRRIIVSAWNVGELERMALMPCHALFQFYVADGKLSCQLYQRSADVFLGVPFNIASYALLTLMMAQVTGLRAGEFVHTLGDAHLYLNHLEQVRTQLRRAPRALPKMRLNPAVQNLLEFQYQDFELQDYDPHPAISAPIAV